MAAGIYSCANTCSVELKIGLANKRSLEATLFHHLLSVDLVLHFLHHDIYAAEHGSTDHHDTAQAADADSKSNNLHEGDDLKRLVGFDGVLGSYLFVKGGLLIVATADGGGLL